MPGRIVSERQFCHIYAKRGTVRLDRLTYLKRRAPKGMSLIVCVETNRYPFPDQQFGNRNFYSEWYLAEYDKLLRTPIRDFAIAATDNIGKADARLNRKLMRDFA